MKIEATKGKQGIGTEVKNATYVEAARWGKYRGWRYVLGLVVILFAWLVVGSGASVLVTFALSGQPNFSVLDPFGKFLSIMASFLCFLAGVLIAVTLIHRRHPLTLVTAQEKISWHRVGQGFVAWSIPLCLIGVLGQYLFYPNTFSFNSDLATFALFAPLVVFFTAIQTTTEELFFRGYIVQGASIIWTNRIFLALVSAVMFMLVHLANPEALAGGWLTVFLNYFLVPGLLWTVVSLIDGTTELAIGVHFANNIIGFLAIDAPGTAVTVPALFRVSEFHATYVALSVLVIIPIFLAIAYKVFKRQTPTRFPEPPHDRG
ncbi:MAG: CPBP family intramembrane metalloprotease [Leptolyngbyaceae cyanobacterium SM1_4_3]|nr:CPBP family intramembrane metalloprotease [Leptolyngbyaceae cyanobacterium SM1_4_3]